jgi:hypothetical protein
MIITFEPRRRQTKKENTVSRDAGRFEPRTPTTRELTRSEIAHRERMLKHLQSYSPSPRP